MAITKPWHEAKINLWWKSLTHHPNPRLPSFPDPEEHTAEFLGRLNDAMCLCMHLPTRPSQLAWMPEHKFVFCS